MLVDLIVYSMNVKFKTSIDNKLTVEYTRGFIHQLAVICNYLSPCIISHNWAISHTVLYKALRCHIFLPFTYTLYHVLFDKQVTMFCFVICNITMV